MERSIEGRSFPLHPSSGKEVSNMNLFFEKLLWPALVVVLMEVIFAASQPHWFLVTLAFAVINVIPFVCFRVIKRAQESPAQS
jgi:hypothetical protein